MSISDISFLLSLTSDLKQLIGQYKKGTDGLMSQTVLRESIRPTLVFTIEDDEMIKFIFLKLYPPPFPTDSADSRLVALQTAYYNWKNRT
jgi:hypothetical protein